MAVMGEDNERERFKVDFAIHVSIRKCNCQLTCLECREAAQQKDREFISSNELPCIDWQKRASQLNLLSRELLSQK